MTKLRIEVELDDDTPPQQQARRVAATLRRYANGVESLGCIPNGPIPLVGLEGQLKLGRAWVLLECTGAASDTSSDVA